MEAGGEMSGGEEVISSGPLFGVSGTGPYNLQVQMSGNFMWVEETDKTPYTLSTIDFTVIKYF
jgi:hypothetical protein